MGSDTEAERPEPVDGTVFPASAGKALGGVFGGIILTASSAPQRIVPLTAPTSGRGTVCRPLVTPGLGSRRAASIG